MKSIICNVNTFGLDQIIYIYDKESNKYEIIGKSRLDQLSKILTETCFANNIDNIHLYGNITYLQGIINDIDIQSGCSAYSNGMIKVEVN